MQCPFCGSTTIVQLVQKDYRCGTCGKQFPTPTDPQTAAQPAKEVKLKAMPTSVPVPVAPAPVAPAPSPAHVATPAPAPASNVLQQQADNAQRTTADEAAKKEKPVALKKADTVQDRTNVAQGEAKK